MTGLGERGARVLGRARRERWWRSVFIVLATIYVGLLLVAALVQLLGPFSQILLIIFLAWLLAFVLSPLVGWLEARGLGRALSVAIVYAGALLGAGFVLFYAASSIASSAADLARDFPETRERIEATVASFQEAISFGGFQPDFVQLYGDVESTTVRLASGLLGDIPGVTVTILGALVLVIVISLYMLADRDRILAKIHRIVPRRWADEVEIFERTVPRAFGGFLRAQVILTVLQAALTATVVILAGLPFGFLIVAAASLAMLIPFFGPPLALLPPIVATAIYRPDLVVVVAPALLVVQTVLINYLQPRLMRNALGMHPILVLVGLLLGAQVAGVWGALFGIPIVAVANVFFNYVVNLRAIEEVPEVTTKEMIEEVRRELPDAPPEAVVAVAAERAEEAADEAAGEAASLAAAGRSPDASAELGTVSEQWRESAGELRRVMERLKDAPERGGEGS